MIARIWRGRVRSQDAATYLDYLHRTGVADYQATPGHLGVTILQREVEGAVEYTILTFWTDMKAIKAFAGADPEISHYYAEDEAFLLEMDPKVQHFEVPFTDLPVDQAGG